MNLARPPLCGSSGRLGSILDLLEEARLEELLPVDREERVDAVADDADDLALAPGRVAHEIALLEWSEHRTLHTLDLEGPAAPRAAVAAERLLEQRAAGGRV